MSSDEKNIKGGGEGSSRDTPQAITITIMAPSALETTTIDSALVASVETQDGRQSDSSLLVVPSEGNGSISVTRGAKDLLQTVTETHMGSEDLPVISNINSSEDTTEESTIQLGSKDKLHELVESEEGDDLLLEACHCLICDDELLAKQLPVFKSLTTTSQRKVSIFLGGVVGQKLTSRKAHSSIMCEKCFGLLNKLDLLEVQIRDTKEEIVTKYQGSVSKHGGRGRRKKPAAAVKSEYVFPKIEPDDEDQQALALEMDETFEPHVDDLMEEEHDRREDRESHDEEWEPEFKRARVKRELSTAEASSGPPKRKRGRPRKDASKSKETTAINTLPTFIANFESLHCPCGVQSRSKIEYVDHMLKHRCKIFKCPKCSLEFSSSFYLVRHQHIIHSGNRENTDIASVKEDEQPLRNVKHCKYCNEEEKEDLLDHLKIHLYGENECPVCAIGFYTSQSMEMHLKKRHVQSVTSFLKFKSLQKERNGINLDTSHHLELCDICGKAITSSLKLAQHRYSQHPEHYPWPCGDCKLSFPSQADLENHSCSKKRVLRRKKQTGSTTSTKKTKDKTTYKSQLSQNKNSTADPITCPVCSLVLVNRKEFTNHIRFHKVSGLKCKFCDAKFKTLSSLRTHLNVKHTHGEIHQCKTCSKIFFSTGRLAYHLKREHTDRVNYRNLCHLCGKGYPYPSELKLHLRSHRNERPYKCDQCPKTFMKRGDLTYHIRSHTGERPHKCPHCSARFPRPNTLMSHIRQQHKETSSVLTADASTTTCKVESLEQTEPPPPPATTTALPTCLSTTVMVLSPSVVNNVNTAAQQQKQTGNTVMAVSGESVAANKETRTQGKKTMIPVVDGQLIDGQVPEVQPVQYVQVDGLAAGQTVQSVQPVPHMMESMEYEETGCGSYQLVHLQILP